MRKTLYCLLTLLLLASPCHAIFGVGDIVFDPQAFTQMLIDYIVTTNQYSTQMDQYRAQYQQLQNDYTNMRNLGYKADLSNLNNIRGVMESATGISNDYAQMQTQFEKLYPGYSSYKRKTGADYAAQAQEWSRTNQQNAKDVLTLGTRLQESIKKDQQSLSYLNDRSYSASGTKDLLQSMNQLLVLATKQLMQLQQILTSSAKANAAYMAEQASRDDSARASGDNLIKDWKKTDAPTRKKAPMPGEVLK